ncbi:MAG: HD-GYP domain-containing protein [Candidatus Omnitrophica bacterium]|nr:HD-GYP domain-containing protein [Candidatus Omnitrophota bacterium]
MVKLSDFFRKEDEPESREEPKEKTSKEAEQKYKTPLKPPEEKLSISIPREEIKKELPSEEASTGKSPVRTAELLKESISVLGVDKTGVLYVECLKLSEEILKKAQAGQPVPIAQIKEKTDRLVEQIVLGNCDLAGLLNTYTDDNYLYAHSLNVCILAVLVGQGLGYDRLKLQELGIAAFLHDIGMIKFMDLSQKPVRFTKDEHKEIEEHAELGAEILSASKHVSEAIISVASQHHECVNGKGYPKRLKGQEINECAKIVAAADYYEALMHPRSHRERLNPYEALRVLIENKERFDYRVLKVLIKQMGVYPIGSLVQLSSGEIGIVVKTNSQSALRPIVKIFFDAQGKRVEQEKNIDLIKSPTIVIKKPIQEKDLNL